jgi:hypothetical protein
MNNEPMTFKCFSFIEKFDKEIDAFWDSLKPKLKGKFFPDAAAMAKVELNAWLARSITLRHANGYSDEAIAMASLTGPLWVVICDITNNPPAEQAINHLNVTIFAKMFGYIIRRDLNNG